MISEIKRNLNNRRRDDEVLELVKFIIVWERERKRNRESTQRNSSHDETMIDLSYMR